MANNGNGFRGYILTATTTAAAIFNLTAILLICFIMIPLTARVTEDMAEMRKQIDEHSKVMKRLNDAMDANEARSKAAKKDAGK